MIIILCMLLLIINSGLSKDNFSMVEQCHFTNLVPQCDMVRVGPHSSINFPLESCIRSNCDDCILRWESRVVLKNKTLVEIERFRTHAYMDPIGKSKIFKCTEEGLPCECSSTKRCNGTLEFCMKIECSQASPCICEILPATEILILLHKEEEIPQPLIVSYTVCDFRKRDTYTVGESKPNINDENFSPSRHLLSDEQAAFSQHHTTVKFSDSIFTLPAAGTLILRKDGMEGIFTIAKTPFHIIAPETMLLQPGALKFIFVSTKGDTVDGTIHLEGRDLCRQFNCIICLEAWYQLNCLPSIVQYGVYTVLILLTSVAIIYIRTVFFCIKTVIITIKNLLLQFTRLFKGVKRYSMLTGVLAGDALRQTVNSVGQTLERRARNMRDTLVPHPHHMLAIIMLIPLVAADCSNHQIISGTLKNCQETKNGQLCLLETQAQITLTNIEFTQCLWFTNENNQNLFKLEISFEKVECHWSTQRLYYTWPTELHSIFSISCPQSEACGWGSHCVQNKEFAAMTKQSKLFPGLTRCQGGHTASYCYIVDSEPCLFSRLWLQNDISRAYQVKKLNSMSCRYQLQITETANDTQEIIKIKSHAITENGISIKIIGAYNQPTELLSSYLIQRVGDPTEAYIDSASALNRPIKSSVGDVQGNSSVTHQFIFAPDMFECNFYEDKMSCTKPNSYLEQLTSSGENRLPKAFSYHKLFITPGGKLQSEMLHSEPLLVHLSFNNYKFYTQTTEVCPRFVGKIPPPQGCYSCEPLSVITIEAYSTCLVGTVQVSFESIQISTRSIKLTQSPQKINIQFRADSKCYKEKICLKARSIITCEPIAFCLSEPLLHIQNPNVSSVEANYIPIQTTSSGWESLFANLWPDSIFGIFKYPVMIICAGFVIIFVFSCMLSSLRR